MKHRCDLILGSGATVIITTKGIDDIASKYLCEKNCMGIRRVSKNDIRRIAKSTGATVITTLATAEGEESFDPSSLGFAQEVVEEAVGDNDFIFFKGMKSQNAAT